LHIIAQRIWLDEIVVADCCHQYLLL